MSIDDLLIYDVPVSYTHLDVYKRQAEENIILSPAQFPELRDHKGEDLIVTNGKTLLGADDKAGIAEIVSAIAYLKEHPEIKHGKIRIGFNPDEEIGEGAHKFDVEKFGCEWAYTCLLYTSNGLLILRLMRDN